MPWIRPIWIHNYGLYDILDHDTKVYGIYGYENNIYIYIYIYNIVLEVHDPLDIIISLDDCVESLEIVCSYIHTCIHKSNMNLHIQNTYTIYIFLYIYIHQSNLIQEKPTAWGKPRKRRSFQAAI
jgi:hypothetical protein